MRGVSGGEVAKGILNANLSVRRVTLKGGKKGIVAEDISGGQLIPFGEKMHGTRNSC